MDWLDGGMDVIVMSPDGFYDMVLKYQKGLNKTVENYLIFDSKVGTSYVAKHNPGRYLSMDQFVPVYVNGEYKGIGEFSLGLFTIKRIHPGLGMDSYGEEDIGMLAKIVVDGEAKKWKFSGVE